MCGKRSILKAVIGWNTDRNKLKRHLAAAMPCHNSAIRAVMVYVDRVLQKTRAVITLKSKHRFCYQSDSQSGAFLMNIMVFDRFFSLCYVLINLCREGVN